MKPAFKTILVSAAVVFFGSILLHYGIEIPGYTAMVIGAIGVCFGPLALDL